MSIDVSKVGKLVPFRPVCEVCGEENEPMATELRKAKLAAGGREPMAMLMPLRPLNMCDGCRDHLIELVRAVRDLKRVGASPSSLLSG